MSIISKSTSEISPIPHLQSDSTVKLPTPPIPNTITLDFFKISSESLPIRLSVLE